MASTASQSLNTEVISIRVSPALVARVEAYEKKLVKNVPKGVNISQADALRTILEAGLDVLEEKK